MAAGIIGQPPLAKPQAYQINLNTRGRLQRVEEFNDIIVKTGAGGRVVRLGEVARTATSTAPRC